MRQTSGEATKQVLGRGVASDNAIIQRWVLVMDAPRENDQASFKILRIGQLNLDAVLFNIGLIEYLVQVVSNFLNWVWSSYVVPEKIYHI
jgi:hypothetical protein